MPASVHLMRDAERTDEIEALASMLGGRVGLDGVLAALTRRAHRVPVPGRRATWGFTPNLDDLRSKTWWPQGITTSADHAPAETYAGRRLVLTSSYAKPLRGVVMGSRISVFDITRRRRIRYQHVLLAEAVVDQDSVTVRPVPIHAGGIVWHGPYLHVAGTERGLYTFRLDDIMSTPGTTPETFGHQFVLPMRYRYAAKTAACLERVRYSFLSLDRSDAPHTLIAGEYGRSGQTTRLLTYAMDDSGLLGTDADDLSYPLAVDLGGIEQMQGATSVGGVMYLSQSHGKLTRGSLWSGRPGAFSTHHAALPPGPEDLCYWPSTGELWNLSEHPWKRFITAVKP